VELKRRVEAWLFDRFRVFVQFDVKDCVQKLLSLNIVEYDELTLRYIPLVCLSGAERKPTQGLLTWLFPPFYSLASCSCSSSLPFFSFLFSLVVPKVPLGPGMASTLGQAVSKDGRIF
jgi:hypothetical protein